MVTRASICGRRLHLTEEICNRIIRRDAFFLDGFLYRGFRNLPGAGATCQWLDGLSLAKSMWRTAYVI